MPKTLTFLALSAVLITAINLPLGALAHGAESHRQEHRHLKNAERAIHRGIQQGYIAPQDHQALDNRLYSDHALHDSTSGLGYNNYPPNYAPSTGSGLRGFLSRALNGNLGYGYPYSSLPYPGQYGSSLGSLNGFTSQPYGLYDSSLGYGSYQMGYSPYSNPAGYGYDYDSCY